MDVEVARTHYEALKSFLASHLEKEQAKGAGSRTNAREKLTRLTKQQFRELSTDVYDELTRRLMNTNEVPFLPVRDEFHPKRNQARQKLATLQPTRFKDLASDVYYELDRRHPEFRDIDFPSQANANESNSPPTKLVTSQAPKSNIIVPIVPEKGTLKEIIMDYTIQKPNSRPEAQSGANTLNKSDNSNNYPPIPNGMPPEYGAPPRSPRSRTQSQGSSVSDFGQRYRSISSEGSSKERSRDTVSSQKGNNKNEGLNTKSLDSLMKDIGSMFDGKMPNGDAQPSSSRNELYADLEKIKSDYELRIASMQKRINELEAELEEKVLNSDDARTQDLDKQLKINQQQAAKLAKLEEEFNKLNEDHQQQQEVTNDVRKEATTLLDEIKSLSQCNDDLLIAREQDAAKIKALTAEAEEWKNKFEKKKTELRNLKATSSFVREPPKFDIKDNLLVPTPDGAIDEARIIKYQVAIDDLLRAGRSDVPTEVLVAMKNIVITCKSVTEDVENYEQQKSASMKSEDKEKLNSLKSKLSATLTNLMTAAKNHATGFGVSPVSLLDAAASHLTATLVELVKLIKLKRSNDATEEEKNEDLQKLNNNLSVDSLSPSPRSKSDLKTSNFQTELRPENGHESIDIEEFKKEVLEVQTTIYVESIQKLLSKIREGTHYKDITGRIDGINSDVFKVISECHKVFESPSGAAYRVQGEGFLQNLQQSLDLLEEIRESITNNPDDFDRNLKQQLATASFNIAKLTKQLVGLF